MQGRKRFILGLLCLILLLAALPLVLLLLSLAF